MTSTKFYLFSHDNRFVDASYSIKDLSQPLEYWTLEKLSGWEAFFCVEGKQIADNLVTMLAKDRPYRLFRRAPASNFDTTDLIRFDLGIEELDRSKWAAERSFSLVDREHAKKLLTKLIAYQGGIQATLLQSAVNITPKSALSRAQVNMGTATYNSVTMLAPTVVPAPDTAITPSAPVSHPTTAQGQGGFTLPDLPPIKRDILISNLKEICESFVKLTNDTTMDLGTKCRQSEVFQTQVMKLYHRACKSNLLPLYVEPPKIGDQKLLWIHYWRLLAEYLAEEYPGEIPHPHDIGNTKPVAGHPELTVYQCTPQELLLFLDHAERMIGFLIRQIISKQADRNDAHIQTNEMTDAASQTPSQLIEANEESNTVGVMIKSKTDWRDIQNQLLGMRERGEPYTTQKDLAEKLTCSTSTVNKAINNSDTLKGWMNRSTIPSPRAIDLSATVTDNAVQSKEPPPGEVISEEEVDAVMAKLIEQAKPDERANLHSMNDDQRRKMAVAYQSQRQDDEPSSLEHDAPGKCFQSAKAHKRV